MNRLVFILAVLATTGLMADESGTLKFVELSVYPETLELTPA